MNEVLECWREAGVLAFRRTAREPYPLFQLFSQLSTMALIGLAAMSGLAIWVLGLVTNAVLRDRGFGVFANGTVMFAGFLAGALTRLAIFGRL